MLRNLLSNALRYTERGKILLGCRRAGDRLRIEVWDSGIGIAEVHIGRIFDEHYQVEDRTHLGSFGLGLLLLRRAYFPLPTSHHEGHEEHEGGTKKSEGNNLTGFVADRPR